MTANVYVRFEFPLERDDTLTVGPFEWIQATYDAIRTSPEGDDEIAHMTKDGLWMGPDRRPWSDFIIYAEGS